MVKLMAGLVALAIASSAIAGETQKNTERIPSLKSGECSITLLDADGIKPLAGAKLVLQSAKDAKNATTVEANKAGACIMDIADGRYILSVNDRILTLIDASKDGQLAWCRIVVSEKPMLIGGQDVASTSAFTFMGLDGAAAVTAAVAAGLGGTAAVVAAAEAINDDDDDDNDFVIEDGGVVVDDDDDDDENPPPASP